MLKEYYANAVGYVRCSTEMQDDSINQQKSGIEKASKKLGLNIIDYFEDDGKSGTSFTDRPGFMKLKAAVENNPNFKYILVYDESRWGRASDPRENSFWKQYFKTFGVKVIIINTQSSNGDDLVSCLVEVLEGAQASEYSKNLSRVTLRGQLSNAEKGYSNGGTAPYGYKRVAINKHTNGAIGAFYPIATTAKMTQLLAWFDEMPAFSMTSHQDCGFCTIVVVNDKGEWDAIENYFDVEGLIKWSNKVWDMVQEREVPKPTGLLKGINLDDLGAIFSKIGEFVDDMTDLGYRQIIKAYYFAGAARYIKDPGKILTSKTYQGFARLVMNPNFNSAANFLHSRNLLISSMHFQDSYNFDLDRVCSCLVHYGVIDPEDPTKVREIPFCAMNTLHRPIIERQLAIEGQTAKKPEVIQAEIEELLSKIQE